MKRFVWFVVVAWLSICLPAFAVSPTKTRTSIWAAVTLVPATPQTSTSQNLTAVFESQIDIRITNGGTGPTIAAQVQVQVANDSGGTLWTNYGGALVGTTTNSDVSYFSVTIPIGVAAARLVGSANTGQNVTLDADISTVTAISSIDPPFEVANDNWPLQARMVR